MSRYIVDQRFGCITIRDTHNHKYNIAQDTYEYYDDVIFYSMGEYINNQWEIDDDLIVEFNKICELMNNVKYKDKSRDEIIQLFGKNNS